MLYEVITDGYREIGVESLIAESLFWKSQLRIAQGHYEQAGELINEAWKIAQRSGLDASIAFVLTTRARLARLQGNLLLAQNHMQDLPDLYFSLGVHKLTIPLEWGALALQTGDLAEAASGSGRLRHC